MGSGQLYISMSGNGNFLIRSSTLGDFSSRKILQNGQNRPRVRGPVGGGVAGGGGGGGAHMTDRV